MNDKIERRAMFKEVDGIKYYFIDFGSERHGHTSFRLWVSERFVYTLESEYGERQVVLFPVIGATIQETEKKTKILKKGDNIVYEIDMDCGYRGESDFEIKTSFVKRLDYYFYHSPLGNLGVSIGGIVEAKTDKIIYSWKKTGRLYGASSKGVSVLYSDGRKENVDDISELNELSEIND